ncbi:MAG: aminotransferase class I/II-fold pyridoxal phosphate-dependent enzyme [Bacteroidetes bacterium]|nr:aminotransferase class I/II-fold pyridoxal phosphate-dependent enzyme [Bacteroidota bacterium]
MDHPKRPSDPDHNAAAVVPGFGTACVKNRHIDDKAIHPHREAIYPTSAFTFPDSAEAMRLFEDRNAGYIYGRWNNPTAEAAARAIADLETLGTGLEATARLFGSGMAAISAALMGLLKPGQAVLTQHQLYGGTDELLRQLLAPWGIKRVQVDLNRMDELDQALSNHPEIAVVYAETPSNPMLYCADLQALSAWSRSANLPLIVDNTFATPWLQQPLALGADLVVHSTTKFLNGHGSALGGAVVSTRRDLMDGPIFQQLKLMGASPSPFDAWLLLSGLKTLELRMERHCANAHQVAAFLQGHKAVEKVFYIGLPEHPYHAVAARQMRDFGALMSIELNGGMAAAIRLMDRVRICTLATTLGTPDTLIQHPASMTHLPVPREERLAAGITDGLVRIAVGIENARDIIADLDQALEEQGLSLG